MKIQTDGHGQNVPLPLSQVSICKMKNNGIPLPPRNVIHAVRLVKCLLVSNGECRSTEDRPPCDKNLFAIKEFSVAFILPLTSSFS